MGDVEAQQGSQEYRIMTRHDDVCEEKQSSERPRSVWWPLPRGGLASPGKAVVRHESGVSGSEEGGVRR